MKAPLLLCAAGVLFLAAFMITGSSGGAGPEAQAGFSLCLTADQAIYAPGEPLRLTLTAANHTSRELVLRFKDAQRFDFRLEQAGQEVWRWSQGRMFAQMLGEERLSPGASLSFSATCAEKLAPGRYQITGIIAAAPQPLAASFDIAIR